MTGSALVITSLVLCGGLFIYTTSFLANNVRFGLLTGCAVLFALAADFLLVPALLSIIYSKKQKAGGEGLFGKASGRKAHSLSAANR